MSWNRLEHQVWNQLKLHDLTSRTLVLAVSGGLDSMVLLHLFKRLNLKTKIIVAHFHHGETTDSALKAYRDSALALVKNSVENFEFRFEKAPTQLHSEADFRAARRGFIHGILAQNKGAVVVTAHHQNDRLETFLLKMMRGSGLAGLKNFKDFNGRVFRPFLHNQKNELSIYAQEKKIQWVEDPSNQNTEYLRNWLRQDLFPKLEYRHSGALRNLFTSMDRLLKTEDEDRLFLSTHRKNTKVWLKKDSKNSCVIELNRPWYIDLDQSSKEKVLFLALKQAQSYKFAKNSEIPVSNLEKKSAFWDITKGRVKEIRKRLDKNQKDIKFVLGPLKALTSSKKIMLQFKL